MVQFTATTSNDHGEPKVEKSSDLFKTNVVK